MKIICDSCQTKYSIADEKVRGKVFKIKCKKCKHIIVVRGAAGEAAAPAVDEKETKVFDYSGYDNPSEAAAAMAVAGGDEAVWHLVIDQEQVGPLTRAEVLDRFRSGQIDAEAYTWREGFGDWQRLAAVEDFAADVAGGEAPAAGGGAVAAAGLASSEPPLADDAAAGMFGGAFDDGAAQNDPADLFSAAAGDAGMGDGGGLFGGDSSIAVGGGGGGGGGLFGDPDAGMGGGGGMAAAQTPAEALTGERNENSVLFSLSNLASLAADAPKASPVSSARGGGGSGGGGGAAGMAQAGGKEGSGLIDIRSMAQVYLGGKQGGAAAGPAGPAAPDDLPVFSSGAFEGGGQVLLPTAQTGGNNKILYALMGLIGLLAVVAVVLTVVILNNGDDKRGGDGQLAAQNADGDRGNVTPPDTGDTVGDTGDTEGDTGETGGDTASDTGDTADGAKGAKSDKSSKGSSKGSKGSKGSRSAKGSKGSRSARGSKGTKGSKGSKGSKGDSTSRGSSGRKEKCDEVACLVDPSLPCCRRGSSRGSKSSRGSRGTKGSVDPNLRDRPSRTDISAGIGKVRGRVQSCGDKHGFKGTVTVKITVAGSGKVTNAKANKGSGSFKGCVKSAVKKAKFKKSKKGITVNYPFVFR